MYMCLTHLLGSGNCEQKHEIFEEMYIVSIVCCCSTNDSQYTWYEATLLIDLDNVFYGHFLQRVKFHCFWLSVRCFVKL